MALLVDGKCSMCDTPFSAAGGSSSLALGPCGHTLCLFCATTLVSCSLTELMTAPPPAAAYLAPPANGAVLPLPGLFCVCCAPSPQARRDAAEAHWRVFVAGLREKKRGVAWRLDAPRGDGAPWSATWSREDAPVFSLAVMADGRVEASTGEAFSVPPGGGGMDVAFSSAGVFVWPSSAFEGGKDPGGARVPLPATRALLLSHALCVFAARPRPSHPSHAPSHPPLTPVDAAPRRCSRTSSATCGWRWAAARPFRAPRRRCRRCRAAGCRARRWTPSPPFPPLRRRARK